MLRVKDATGPMNSLSSMVIANPLPPPIPDIRILLASLAISLHSGRIFSSSEWEDYRPYLPLIGYIVGNCMGALRILLFAMVGISNVYTFLCK